MQFNKRKKNDKAIAICGHTDPDYDTIGSTFAMALALKQMGKNAKVLFRKENLNLLDNIIPAKCMELICFDTSKQFDCFILLACNREDRIGEFINQYNNAKTKLIIDHHGQVKLEANEKLIVHDISATCEILYFVFKKLKIEITKSIAELLYMGLITDNQLFIKRTTPQTLMVASKLFETEFNYREVSQKVLLYKTFEEVKMLNEITSNLKKDIVHFMEVDLTKPIFEGLDYNTISKKFIPQVEMITGIDILAIQIIYKDKLAGEFRSNCHLDVDEIAKQLGGGGHKKSSGYYTTKSVSEVKDLIKKYFKEKLING